ncbi:MAG: glucose 1-dehydrogenase [Planctomycetota bacterium]
MSQQRHSDRRALVSGATSGIGRATALRLVQEGAFVVGTGRNDDELEALREAGGDRLIPLQADLTDAADRKALVQQAIDRMGGLDILVNSAGMIEMGGVEAAGLEDFDRTMNLNVRALYDLTRLSLPALIESRGNIVNVSSVAGIRAFPGVMAYCVSKAAVDQITRCAALELADKGVRVNAVNPGVVVTNLHRRGGMGEEQYADFLKRSALTHPLGRAGTAEEVAGLIAYLASDEASWITGVTYAIDGGRGETCLR